MSVTNWDNSRVPARKGIRAAMEDRANKVMGNVLLAAWARISAAVGPPLAVALIVAGGTYLIASRSDSAVQAAEQEKLAASIRDLEKYRIEAYGRGQAMLARLDAVQKALDRIDQRLDQQQRAKQ